MKDNEVVDICNAGAEPVEDAEKVIPIKVTN
jgi:hypothetical protein